MHTDPEAAKETQYGGLIAGGLHTICIATRPMMENFLNDSTNRGGLGIDNLQWHRLAHPGDVLRVHHEMTERRESDSHTDAGIVARDIEVLDQDDAALASWTTAILIGERES